MKKVILVATCFSFIVCLFSGCGSSENKNSDINNDLSYESGSDASDEYTEDEYFLARNVFVDKYKASIDEMQRVISGFDFSEESWKKYRQLRDEINGISTTFFGNEAKVSDKNLSDFSKIKEQVTQYSIVINKMEGYRDKTANEQASVIADIVKNMNKINLNWKKNIDIKN